MATHSSIPAWEIPWTEEPGGLQLMGSQRVGHDWSAQWSTLPFIPHFPWPPVHNLPNFLDLISKPRSLSLPTGHVYSYLRPLLSPYKVDEQFFPLKSTHWENFLLPLSLVSPLNEAILHQWVTFEWSYNTSVALIYLVTELMQPWSKLQLFHPLPEWPCTPCSHRYELRDRHWCNYGDNTGGGALYLFNLYLPAVLLMPDPDRLLPSYSELPLGPLDLTKHRSLCFVDG